MAITQARFIYIIRGARYLHSRMRDIKANLGPDTKDLVATAISIAEKYPGTIVGNTCRELAVTVGTILEIANSTNADSEDLIGNIIAEERHFQSAEIRNAKAAMYQKDRRYRRKHGLPLPEQSPLVSRKSLAAKDKAIEDAANKEIEADLMKGIDPAKLLDIDPTQLDIEDAIAKVAPNALDLTPETPWSADNWLKAKLDAIKPKVKKAEEYEAERRARGIADDTFDISKARNIFPPDAFDSPTETVTHKEGTVLPPSDADITPPDKDPL